ncbi:hypothetical protein EYV94_18070 [Puteibacter caeruleilacunae]|nr:hypothetical protein EYV94_18070 [Puteibacter caeruleilacunae]
MKNEELLIKSLSRLIDYGNSLLASENYIGDLPNYAKYVDSIKNTLRDNCKDRGIREKIESFPEIDYKHIRGGCHSSFSDGDKVKHIVSEYIKETNILAENIMFRLEWGDIKLDN